MPAIYPECGQRHKGDAIVLLGWGRYPLPLRRATSLWLWAMGIFLLAFPWALAHTRLAGRTWAPVASSAIALVLIVSLAIERVRTGIPQTMRITLRREGVLQDQSPDALTNPR